jgi:hypothetical protein
MAAPLEGSCPAGRSPGGSGMWRGSPPEATKTPGPCGTRRRPNMMDCSLSRLSVQNGRTKSWWSAPQRQQHGVSRRRARRHVGTPAPAKPRAHSVGPSCRAQPRGGFSCRGAQKRRKRRAQKAGGLTDVRRDAVALLVDVDDGGVGLLGGGEHAPAHEAAAQRAQRRRQRLHHLLVKDPGVAPLGVARICSAAKDTPRQRLSFLPDLPRGRVGLGRVDGGRSKRRGQQGTPAGRATVLVAKGRASGRLCRGPSNSQL